MKTILGYMNKKGAGITCFFARPDDMVKKLEWCKKNRIEATAWMDDNREYEVGWSYKHDEAGWVICYDDDIFKP